MRYLVFLAVLLSEAVSALTCPSGRVYVRFVKNSGASFARQESFEVYSGTTKLYTSPIFADAEERVLEQCLRSFKDNQYTVRMISDTVDSWYSGSYLTIYGQYGNVFFKNFLTHTSEETHQFSLYYGIYQSSQWRLISGYVVSGWTAYGFDDNNWSLETLGSTTVAVFGTQYFRKPFTGLTNMAAYDVRMYYKAGVVAYINGAEVYRDNMPEGEVESTTAAIGQYKDLAYRGFIRPGSEVGSSESILAVEIHFLTSQTNVDFNAYLALLAPSALGSSCFIYGEPTQITATSGSKIENVFDFSRSTYAYFTPASLPSTITVSFEGPRPLINSVRLWPYNNPTASPTAFSFQGSYDGSAWTTIIDATGIEYEMNTYRMFNGYFHSALYNHYQTTISSNSSSNVNIYEMQPLVCSILSPKCITFTPNSYTFYAYYQKVLIKPDIDEFSSCSSQNLPEGLSIDANTCEITGYGMNVVHDLVVTVTSVVLGNTYNGTFNITFTECEGTLISVLRTYQTYAYYESFDIKDAATLRVVMSVAYNSGQVNSKDWEGCVCVTGSKYIVTSASSIINWQPASLLYIRSILDRNQMETVLRLKYDINVGFPSIRTFNAAYAVKPHSQWYYKHGEVPENWHSCTCTEGWIQGTDSSFPSSSNQIQLYKTNFTVSDISNVAGVVLSIKYKYGIVVYMNGNEAFRNGVTGTVSTSSYGSNTYSDVMYRQISLPLTTVQIGETTSVNYIRHGSNTIAIALFAVNSQQTEVNFDCAVRLMGESSESRIFDYDVDFYKVSGNPSLILNHYYSYTMYYTTCTENYFNIAFYNDRREWINAAVVKLHFTQNEDQPSGFILKARNSGENWTVLATFNNLTWLHTGQSQTLYFRNNKAFNEYRFENFTSYDSRLCRWKINTLDLRSVMTTMTIPKLSYTFETLYKDIKMAELYPNSEYYFGFEVSPDLPDGIYIDHNTGVIYGIPKVIASYEVTITANKFTGGTSATSFIFNVVPCTGGRSLVTLVVRTDAYPEKMSYKLHRGIGTRGAVVNSIDRYNDASTLVYSDFCMNDDIYTLELLDSSRSGWDYRAGYYLTVDADEITIEMGQVPSGVLSVSTMFSSYFPFQMGYSDWKVNKLFIKGWMDVNYDDSSWISAKSDEIGVNEEVTTYIRHDVTIPDINNYHVLNIRLKYIGGVAAYFNGRLVARFNLEDDFEPKTECLVIHNSTIFSKFHTIMSTVGGISGRNVIGFEVHQSRNESSVKDVVFDATGVFGVNDCSVVLDSYSFINGTDPISGKLEQLLELNPTHYISQPNQAGTFVEWIVENLEGSKFNSFAMQSLFTSFSYGFSLYGRYEVDSDYSKVYSAMDQSVWPLSRTSWQTPLGLAGFSHLRFEVDVPSSTTVVSSSYILLFCSPRRSGACPGVSDFPSADDGDISISTCGYGYQGYSYRRCENGKLGEVNREKCVQKRPSKLVYDCASYEVVVQTPVYIPPPRYLNIINEFNMMDGSVLPPGLSLNNRTGDITGIPSQPTASGNYTIYGSNDVGTTSVTLSILVRRGVCEADGVFADTYVGEIAQYDCASTHASFGTLKRACILGEKDGEWQSISGVCVPLSFVVTLIAITLIVSILVIVVYIRKTGMVKRNCEEKKNAESV